MDLTPGEQEDYEDHEDHETEELEAELIKGLSALALSFEQKELKAFVLVDDESSAEFATAILEDK